MKSIKVYSAEVAFMFITLFAGVVANLSPVEYEEHVASYPTGYPDSYPPVILYIRRTDPDPYPPPVSSTSVDFNVTFSEDVTDVDIDDFSLTTTGVMGASITGVSGTGNVYIVTVNTGMENGTIRLDVPSHASVADLAGNPLAGLPFTLGEVYWIIKNATFTDVPVTYQFWNYIEALYNAGVTGGCATSPLMYCPGSTVTRAQMAIFLLRAKYGADHVPPPATEMFSDVPVSSSTAPWIEELANEGITGGCSTSPLKYCPGNSVTRAQMAVFLLRAKYGADYTPPAATGVFADVPVSHWTAPWIEQLAEEGITGGCGGSNYCPGNPVTRAQMAIFLVRTFNLPTP